MPDNKIPDRPTDPIGSAIYDFFYGPASQGTPFNKLGQQIDGLKEDLKSILHVSKSVDEMNKTMKEANSILRETNNTIKILSDRLK